MNVERSHVRLRLKAVHASLTPAGRKLCDYVLEHPAAPLEMTISELSAAAGVSDATVTRLCQTVGYLGFAEFRLLLARDLVSAGGGETARLAPADAADDIRDKLIAASMAALNDTRVVLDVDAVRRAADTITKARRVEAYGLGGSAVVAMDIRHKLLRLGIPIASHSDVDIMAISSATLSVDDVAIGVSHTGRTEAVVAAVERARQGGASTIAFTHASASPLAAVSDITLTYAARPTAFSSDSLTGRIAQLVTADILYATIAGSTYERSEELVKRAQVLADSRRLKAGRGF